MVEVQSLIPAGLYGEGLDSGAVQELLDNIDEKAKQVRTSLFQAFGSQLQPGRSLPRPVLEAMAAVGNVHSAGPSEGYLSDYAHKYMELQSYVDAIQAELQAARAAADLEATTREFRSFLDNGLYMEAAFSVVQLRKILEDSAHVGGGSAATQSEAAALQAASRQCETELQEALASCVHESFDVERAGCVLTVTPELPGGGSIGGVWLALERAGLAEAQLQFVVDTLLQEVLPPVMGGGAALEAHYAPGGESASVTWRPLPPGEAVAPGVLEDQVSSMLHILAEALFGGQASVVAAFGAKLWQPFVDLYQRRFLQQADGASIDALRTRQAAARRMEAAAKDLGFTAGDACLEGSLSAAVQRSYHVQQQAYLERARAVVCGHQPHREPQQVGRPLPVDAAFYERYKRGEVQPWELVDPPSGFDVHGPLLARGLYRVTPTAVQLAMAMDDTLSDACASGDPSCAQALVVAVSKMAAMLEALVPETAYSAAPQLALLRYNDLSYVADHLLLLPFLYSPTLERLAGGEVWYGDEAARLRAAARGVIARVVADQGGALGEALGALRGALRAGGGAEGAAARKAREGLLLSLQRLGRVAWPTLAPAAAVEFCSRLLGPLFQALVEDILARGDIGEADCRVISELCRPLAERAVEEVVAPLARAPQGLVAPPGVDVHSLMTHAVEACTWGVRKLRAVLRMLDARLSDIVAMWEGGELTRGRLSRHEVERLVHALFEDTDYRAQCLQRIRATDP